MSELPHELVMTVPPPAMDDRHRALAMLKKPFDPPLGRSSPTGGNLRRVS